MNKSIGYVILTLAIAGVVAYAIVGMRKNDSTSNTNNAVTVQRLSTNGVTFESPKNVAWLDVPSTEGNYRNYLLNSSARENMSSIMVSIPLQESSQAYSLADIVKPFTDVAGIKAVTLNGHSGEGITYRLDTRDRNDDIPWAGAITREEYSSAYRSSSINLEYHHGDGDDSLEAVWQQVRSSITW